MFLQLAQFTDTRVVERKKIAALTRLPHEEVTEILSNVSRMVPKKGWEFLLPYDSEFVSNFPTVVERQRLIWEVVKNQQARTRRLSERDDKSNVIKKGDDFSLRECFSVMIDAIYCIFMYDFSVFTGSLSPPRKPRSKSFSSDTDSGAETEGGKKRRSRKNSGRVGSNPEQLVKVKIEKDI